MTLAKAGDGSVSDEAFNALVDAVNAGSGAQPVYSGGGVTPNNGSTSALPLDNLLSGTELLDRSVTAGPKFLAAGTYAITATAESSAPLTAGGIAILAITVGASGREVSFAPSSRPELGWSASFVGKAEAGDGLQIAVDNYDGAAARTFDLYSAVIVKLA